ncbi:MAG: hypothetical protein JNJ40_01435 [Bacteroidia bacterium]|nr:hypothetical protein [Bacteroidia bacterium]
MTVNIIKGTFNKVEAISLLTKMIDVKIKFQEDKIHLTQNEEDIKMREMRIKQLQKELFETRHFIDNHPEPISIKAKIELSA